MTTHNQYLGGEFFDELSRALDSATTDFQSNPVRYYNNMLTIEVNLPHSRLHNIIAYVTESYDTRVVYHLRGIICREEELSLDFNALMQMNEDTIHCRYLLREQHLCAGCSITKEECTVELLRSRVLELAHLADELEIRITGKDTY